MFSREGFYLVYPTPYIFNQNDKIQFVWKYNVHKKANKCYHWMWFKSGKRTHRSTPQTSAHIQQRKLQLQVLPHQKLYLKTHGLFTEVQQTRGRFQVLRELTHRQETQTTHLDWADDSSNKQVGVLVHVQDGVGGGRVGAGWHWHHTSHRSFQRINWDGAIKPIAVNGEEQKKGREEGGVSDFLFFLNVLQLTMEWWSTWCWIWLTEMCHRDCYPHESLPFSREPYIPSRIMFSNQTRCFSISSGNILKTYNLNDPIW